MIPAIPEGSAAVILAAGKGTRMLTDLPKVAVVLNGRPLVRYVLDATMAAGVERLVVVVGYRREQVEAAIKGYPVVIAHQAEQKGTGHAVRMAAPLLADQEGPVVVLAGDIPLIRAETIAALLAQHAASGSTITVLTTDLVDPAGYGRIVRNEAGDVLAIVEEKDATDAIKSIREINSSIYAFDWPFLREALGRLTSSNAQNELYLTDTLAMAVREGRKVTAVKVADADEVSGINTVEQLRALEDSARRREGEGR